MQSILFLIHCIRTNKCNLNIKHKQTNSLKLYILCEVRQSLTLVPLVIRLDISRSPDAFRIMIVDIYFSNFLKSIRIQFLSFLIASFGSPLASDTL